MSDRYTMLSENPLLADQGLSDERCKVCGRRFWVNFNANLICLNGCIMKYGREDGRE